MNPSHQIGATTITPLIDSDFLELIRWEKSEDGSIILRASVVDSISDSSRLQIIATAGESSYLETINIVDSTEFECVPRILEAGTRVRRLLLTGSAEAIRTLTDDKFVILGNGGNVIAKLNVTGKSDRVVRLEGTIEVGDSDGAWIAQGDRKLVKIIFQD